uniref:Uncharacterized protein n=1 Tax=Kalanchoe fedtschenkoi TaxID=63787 RepID=A0A7N0V5N4_KALFE
MEASVPRVFVCVLVLFGLGIDGDLRLGQMFGDDACVVSWIRNGIGRFNWGWIWRNPRIVMV